MLQPCTFNAAAELSPHRHGMLYEIQQSGVANLRCKRKMLDRKIKIKIPTQHDNNLTWWKYPLPQNENVKYHETSPRQTVSGTLSELVHPWNSRSFEAQVCSQKENGNWAFFFFSFSQMLLLLENAPLYRLFPNWSTKFQMSCLGFKRN